MKCFTQCYSYIEVLNLAPYIRNSILRRGATSKFALRRTYYKYKYVTRSLQFAHVVKKT